MDENITDDRKELRYAMVYSLLLTALPWIVQVVNVAFSLRLNQYGLQPLEVRGLPGILTMPLLHADWGHLIANTPPMIVLIGGLFLFHNRGGWPILLYLYIISGFLTWFMGRSSTHIGASGLVYALAAFHFVSGVIKKEIRQLAFAMLVTFLYGGFVWAFFPTLYMGTSISWEGHLSGLLTGIVIALYCRKEGPQAPALLEDEEEENELYSEN